MQVDYYISLRVYCVTQRRPEDNVCFLQLLYNMLPTRHRDKLKSNEAE